LIGEECRGGARLHCATSPTPLIRRAPEGEKAKKKKKGEGAGPKAVPLFTTFLFVPLDDPGYSTCKREEKEREKKTKKKRRAKTGLNLQPAGLAALLMLKNRRFADGHGGE